MVDVIAAKFVIKQYVENALTPSLPPRSSNAKKYSHIPSSDQACSVRDDGMLNKLPGISGIRPRLGGRAGDLTNS